MSAPIEVGLALPDRQERQRVADWLTAAEMQVDTLVEACKLDADVAGRGLGCVVGDGALLKGGYLVALRKHDARLPIVAIVDPADEHDPAFKRGVTTVVRPLVAASLVLAVSLAFGEGRQARRRSRKRVPRVPSRVSGAPATIVDISVDGVRLELPRAFAARLAPQFRLQVPMVALDVVVRRAWVGRATGDTVQCGAMLVDPDPSQQLAWQRIMELSAATLTMPGATRTGTATSDTTGGKKLLGRVSDMLASTSLGGWAHHLGRAR